MDDLIHIVCSPERTPEAQDIKETLTKAGWSVTLSQRIAPAAVLITVGPVPDLSARDLLKGDALVVPAQGKSARQLSEVIAAWIGEDQDVSPAIEKTTDSQHHAYETLNELADSMRGTDLLDQLSTFLTTTQQLAFPLAADGRFESANHVMTHAAETLLELLRASDFEDEAAEVVQAIAEAVATTLLEIHENELGAARSADQLLGCFAQLELGLQTASSLTMLEETFDNLLASGREANSSLVHEMVKLTLAQADRPQDMGAYCWSGHIYLYAARHLIQLLGLARSSEESAISTARELLLPFEEVEDDVLEDHAEEVVLALREALSEIYEETREARAWAHDS